MATDFTNPGALARALKRLHATPGLIPALQAAGQANAFRYSLSATAATLTNLGNQLS